MGRPDGLVPRGTQWYFRMRVPSDLIHILKRERVVSLRTGDYRVAMERHAEELAKFKLQIIAERAKLSSKTPDGASEAEHAFRLVKSYIDKYRSSREFPTKLQLAVLGQDAHDAEVQLDLDLVELLERESHYGDQRIKSVSQQLAVGIDLKNSGTFAKELANQVKKALIELADEDRSMFLGLNPQPGLRMFSSQPTPSLTVGAAAKLFWQQSLMASPATDRTRLKQAATLKVVVDHFDENMFLTEITRAHAIQFRDLLAEAPSNAKKIFGELPLTELVKRRDDPRYRTMKFATQKNYLEMAERFLGWAVDECFIERNPSRDLIAKAEQVAPEDQRDPYTAAELRKIFSTPIYTGCVNDARGFAKPGPNVIKRSRYWLPLISLFTGARPEEILQLTPGHVQVSELGTNFILLTKDMKLKTVNSRREIPIHPTLALAGFLDFVADKRRRGDSLLFDDVPIGSDGTRSGVWSKRYATFARSAGVKADLNCFYSFRHTFKDAARRAEIPEEQSEKLQGWSGGGKKTGRRYGVGYLADQLVGWVAKIEYPKVDFSHICGNLPT